MFRNLPNWANWVAQDADGVWWAYEHEPNQADHGWYENEAGHCAQVARGEAHAGWRETLRRVGIREHQKSK